MYKIHFKDTVTSTNDVVKELARAGHKEGYVLVAERQTAGKGRMTKSFYSPKHSGIYMSVLLRPKLDSEDVMLITPCSAVAVARAIKKVLNIDTQIKWVNDIFYEGKKICGILTEASFDISGKTDFAVLGIGINLAKPKDGFPDELKGVANYLIDDADRRLKEALIKCVLDEFYSLYKNLRRRDFYDEYKERSFILGKEIIFLKDAVTYTATAVDIDKNFRLKVKTPDEKIFTLSSGEVSIKIKN